MANPSTILHWPSGVLTACLFAALLISAGCKTSPPPDEPTSDASAHPNADTMYSECPLERAYSSMQEYVEAVVAATNAGKIDSVYATVLNVEEYLEYFWPALREPTRRLRPMEDVLASNQRDNNKAISRHISDYSGYDWRLIRYYCMDDTSYHPGVIIYRNLMIEVENETTFESEVWRLASRVAEMGGCFKGIVYDD